MISAGYYGKLPARGDFITRGLPRQFVEPWDRFLADGLGQSREILGRSWLDAYLVSPVWRFILGRHICGASAILGLFLPSVDAAGRYFPFTIAVPLPADTPLLAPFERALAWHEKAERIARAALEDHFDLSDLDQTVDRLTISPELFDDPPSARRFALSAPGMRTALLERIAKEHAQDYALFWTEGSEAVTSCVLLSPSLPPARHFAAFIDGGFDDSCWIDEAA